MIAALACALAALALWMPAQATDLGVIGPTYPIAEPHLLDFIQARLQDKARSGELQRLQQQARARAVATIVAPPPLPGIAPSDRARTFYVDPSVTLDHPVRDHQGRLLFAAGTRSNPLHVVSLSRRLLFFDARDAQQVARARTLIDAHPGRVKPILTAGSYLDLMRAWRIPVYYDQHGVLTRRLRITRVPALVSQEGVRLRIDELVP